HDDPQLHTPHGVLTVQAGRELLRLTRPPGGLGLLRFLVLYNFSLPKKALTPSQVESAARAIPSASREEQEVAYRKFVFERMGPKASFLLARIALDHGVEAAGHLAVRASLDDLGRLGHNMALAVGYADLASVLGLPRGLVPIAHADGKRVAVLEVVPDPHDPLRVSRVPAAWRARASGARGDLGGGGIESPIQVAAGGGDRATCARIRRSSGGDPRIRRRFLRTVDGRGKGAHNQLPECGPPDGEVPRK